MAAVPQPQARSRLDLVDAVLLTVAAGQVLAGLLAFLTPRVFYDQVGPFPPENAHFVKDLGSWQVPLGLAALAAVRRPAWRVPMLGILAVHFAMHLVSHVVDVDRSEPAWQGPFAVGHQAVAFVVLAALFAREARR